MSELGQAADVAAPFQGLVLVGGGLTRTAPGYRVGIEFATPAPKVCKEEEQNKSPTPPTPRHTDPSSGLFNELNKLFCHGSEV